MVQGLENGSRLQGSGFRVQGLGFGVRGSGFRVCLVSVGEVVAFVRVLRGLGFRV
jgi:hypothetical protein